MIAALLTALVLATAEDPQPIAVAPLTVAGDVEPGWTPALEEAVRKGLERAGVSYQTVAGTAEHDMVIRARVTEHERLYEIEIEAREADTDAVVLSSKQPCAPCGRDEVVEQLERQAAALGESLLRLDRSPAILAVESDPPGAEVLLDGVKVGTTPMELRVKSGAHRILVRREGHVTRERAFTATSGVRENWQVTLGPLALDVPRPSPPPKPRREPLWPTGWALASVGLPSLAAGITFLALHHRPYRLRCSGADFDADSGLCRSRWTSLPQGAALTAVGGALLVSGITMIAVGHRRRAQTRARTVTPGVAMGAGGFGGVILGRF